MNRKLEISQIKIFEQLIVKIIGIINAISTSKIKKIIVIRKNRIEKGIREEDLGSNPHSNGEFFSRSKIFFFDKIDANIITIKEIKKINKHIIYNKIIIYSVTHWTENESTLTRPARTASGRTRRFLWRAGVANQGPRTAPRTAHGIGSSPRP